jgi:betaine-aldehyde dehydrogenase
MSSSKSGNSPDSGLKPWSLEAECERVSNTFYGPSGWKKADSATTVPVINPANGKQIGSISEPSLATIDHMIAEANSAQQLWYAMSALERTEALHEVARKLRELQPELAEMLTVETGKPFKESFDEISWSITAIDYYAEIGRHNQGTIHGSTVVGQMHYTVKEPMGTVVSILPANYPIVLYFWSAAAALSAGNAVIVKPSEFASLTTLSLMRVFDGILPPGIAQCVAGGAASAKQLVAHKATHMVAFTGSVPTGQAVARTCAEQFKPFLIEASGSDVFVVMPSAPLHTVARAAAFAAFLNNGQVCTSAEKFLVHEDIYDQFMTAFEAEVKKLRVGDGLDNVDLGPLENGREIARIEALVANAVEDGAKIRIGGKRKSMTGELANGYFFEPTILENVKVTDRLFSTEVFGPVAPVYKVSSFQEAMEITNSSPFGLGGTLYSKDAEEIDRFTREIQSGMVWVNAPLLDNDAGPFGGRKMSGIGRQLGMEGLDSFRHPKLVMVDVKASEQDFWWFPYSSEENWKNSGPQARS